MYFYVSLALTWLLFLALFPVSFFWGKRAYKIFIKRDYSEVALKRGVAPAKPAKFAPYVGLLNLTGALIAAYTIFGVLVFHFPYDKWSAMAGSTIWGKILLDWMIRQHAHPIKLGRKKRDVTTTA
jgi:hypothetical protein